VGPCHEEDASSRYWSKPVYCYCYCIVLCINQSFIKENSGKRRQGEKGPWSIVRTRCWSSNFSWVSTFFQSPPPFVSGKGTTYFENCFDLQDQ
jgi:hypothetical protein